MKTRLLRSCLTALIMLVTTASYAYDAYIDGIYYRFIGSYATVTYLDKTYSGNEFAYTGDIVIPNSVSYNGNTYNVIGIDEYAFNYCKYLTNVTIPASVKNIGRAAFSGCSNLVSISIPECVSSIGSDTFWGCSSLKSVTIGSGIESIGVRAFRNCHITEMYCHAIEVPQTDSSTFQQTEIEKATLYVPQVSLESYKNVAPWSNFKEILAIEDSPAIKYDANGDGHITIADVNLIIDYLLKH